MDTTIDLSDSSLNISSIVVVDSSPELKDPDKNRLKKKNRVPGKKLDDTIDLISSDDEEEEDEEDSDSNNSSYNNHQAISAVGEDPAFVTAAESTLRKDFDDEDDEHDRLQTSNRNNDKTSYGTPSSMSFMPSLSSTSTPALVKFPQNDESLEDEANATINESELISSEVIGQCHEVEDEFLNTSSSTVEDGETEEESRNNYNTDTSTHTLVDEEKDDDDDEIPERRQNESSSPSSEHSSLSATTDDEEECDERASHLMSLPSKRRRIMEPDLPATCTTLISSKTGGKVYLVGTAHFSKESQDDVARVIRAVQPDAVVLELCKARVNILHTDEAKIQEEAQNLTVDKMLATLRQNGVVQGTMYLFLLYFSARLTKELGMAPGGEFRRAFLEARNVPGCIIQLGDRPIEITLKRAFTTLTLWQKIKFGYTILTYKDTITAEEVEQCKQKDLLESMLEEIAGEFPALSRVFVQERDLFLAHSLRIAVDSPVKFVPEQSTPHHMVTNEAPTVVGVVGIGHVSGIVANWDKVNSAEVGKLMSIPKTSLSERMACMALRATVLGLGVYACYRVVKIPVSIVKTKFF